MPFRETEFRNDTPKRKEIHVRGLLPLLHPVPLLLRLDRALGFVFQPGQTAHEERLFRIVWQVGGRHRRRRAVQGRVEAGRISLDQGPFGGVQVIPHRDKFLGLRTHQLDGEVHRSGPVDPDETSYQRMGVEAVQQMLPDAPKGEIRLTDVEGHRLIAEEVEVEMFPLGGTLFDQQEALERDDEF